MSEGWTRETDVVVVGSGAAGLSAAATAASRGCKVEVLEKAGQVGGTTAFSGGMPWVPGNEHMAAAGDPDDLDEVLTYINSLTERRAPDPALIETFVREAGRAFSAIESITPLRCIVNPYFSDYYADHPGGRPPGRSLEILPFAERDELGELADIVRGTPHLPNLTQSEMVEAGTLRNLTVDHEGHVLADLKAKLVEREEKGISTKGAALAGALFKGALNHGASVHTGVAVRQLVQDDTGAVLGVRAEADGEEVTVRAKLGVVVATGGFEWNPELVRAFIGTAEVMPLSPPTNVGDGLIMGLEAGAKVGSMSVALGHPAVYDETSEVDGHPMGTFAFHRGTPGVVIVNRAGRRFANEGLSYMDAGKAFRVYDPLTQTFPNDPPDWIVFDQSVRDVTIISSMEPGKPTPKWVLEAPTLDALGDLMELEPGVLREEIERFNGHVEEGHDPDFARGTVWYEGMTSGGPDPAKLLAKCEKAPFYAMKLYDGIIGTIGGLLTDESGRVRRMRDDGVIPGLYAAGNAAAGIFGQTYPGGGSTLGPGITFGYLIGLDLGDRLRGEGLAESVAGAVR
jgi:3-oxosteroid 1-dehydrogenase